jgi:hypothetical protein
MRRAEYDPLQEIMQRGNSLMDAWVQESLGLLAKGEGIGTIIDSAKLTNSQVKELTGNIINSWGLSMRLVDRLSETLPAANQAIIAEAEKRGISPLENFRGERLQALSCLAQLLEKA